MEHGEKCAKGKTWITQVADDIRPLHFTINDGKQAVSNFNQGGAIVQDVISLTARQGLPNHR